MVVDGRVDMKVRDASGTVTVHRLEPGDIFHAGSRGRHVAHPLGGARVLVVERAGSVSELPARPFPVRFTFL